MADYGLAHSCYVSFLHTGRHGVAALDPLRVTVGVQSMGMTGNQVSQVLEKDFAVVAELATQQVKS